MVNVILRLLEMFSFDQNKVEIAVYSNFLVKIDTLTRTRQSKIGLDFFCILKWSKNYQNH